MFNIDLFKLLIIALIIGGLIVWFSIGTVLVSDNITTTELKKQAIENNCAQYNSTTGKFEWIKIEKK